MPDSQKNQLDLVRISIPGPIRVDILGQETIEFDMQVLRMSGVESLNSDQLDVLQTMVRLMAHMSSEPAEG